MDKNLVFAAQNCELCREVIIPVHLYFAYFIFYRFIVF